MALILIVLRSVSCCIIFLWIALAISVIYALSSPVTAQFGAMAQICLEKKCKRDLLAKCEMYGKCSCNGAIHHKPLLSNIMDLVTPYCMGMAQTLFSQF
ncbi:MAG: hypothetical protein U1E98_03315 [Moraxella osloensis]